MKRTLIALTAAAVLTTGCASLGLTDTEQRVETGALAGTAGGATIGSIAGETGWGSVGGGNVYDRSQKIKR